MKTTCTLPGLLSETRERFTRQNHTQYSTPGSTTSASKANSEQQQRQNSFQISIFTPSLQGSVNLRHYCLFSFWHICMNTFTCSLHAGIYTEFCMYIQHTCKNRCGNPASSSDQTPWAALIWLKPERSVEEIFRLQLCRAPKPLSTMGLNFSSKAKLSILSQHFNNNKYCLIIPWPAACW